MSDSLSTARSCKNMLSDSIGEVLSCRMSLSLRTSPVSLLVVKGDGKFFSRLSKCPFFLPVHFVLVVQPFCHLPHPTESPRPKAIFHSLFQSVSTNTDYISVTWIRSGCNKGLFSDKTESLVYFSEVRQILEVKFKNSWEGNERGGTTFAADSSHQK